MNQQLEKKLDTLPREPGVYFHKSKSGEIIYVGKAAVLRSRVRQYFQKSRPFDPKTEALVAEITDTDWTTVETELDALFLESEMIKRYKPRYNILLRDDKSQLYIRIPMKDDFPSVTFTRGPLDDGADYFVPYYNGWAIKKAMKYLRKVFPYSTHQQLPQRVCLQYHLGLCPGVEEQKIGKREYRQSLNRLTMYLRGNRKQLTAEMEKDMQRAAKAQQFEQAAELRNQLYNLKSLQRQIIFSDKEFMDVSKDHALAGLQQLLSLPDAPRRIEGYDISHMQGTNNVASMVVATNGIADKAQYRKFKMKIPGNDDFAHINETMLRRFSGKHKDWPLPKLVLIDGGKGQLSAALDGLEKMEMTIPVIGLAKREEEIVIHKTRSHIQLNMQQVMEDHAVAEGEAGETLNDNSTIERIHEAARPFISDESDDFIIVRLPRSTHISKLLQRIRDESHRFAVSYHTHLKRTGQVKSVLAGIPGVGPATRKKLLKVFGSTSAIGQASVAEIAAHVGLIKAKTIKAHIAPINKV